MDKTLIAKAFNEWMRRYTETPKEFEAEFESVIAFLKEQNEGKEPSYGEECAEYLFKICNELSQSSTEQKTTP